MSSDVFDEVLRLAQDCVSRVPVIVLGSGASAAHGLPSMPALADYLLAHVNTAGLDDAEAGQWAAFQAAIPQTDLESALTDIHMSDALTARIVRATWELIADADRRLFRSVIADWTALPLTRLYRHLFSSARLKIDVVTTNYDLIAEYAADTADFCRFTGFAHGTIRSRYIGQPVEFSQNQKLARTINVWKVHGSLDWFETSQKVPIGLPIPETPYEGLAPVIVTPGIDKYRRTQAEPFRTILTAADTALANADSYFCIGYGFNDEHIQPKLIEKCRTNPVPLVLITKTISPKAKDFLSSGSCLNYLAIEDNGRGSRAYSNAFADGVDLPEQCLWSLDGFLSAVI